MDDGGVQYTLEFVKIKSDKMININTTKHDHILVYTPPHCAALTEIPQNHDSYSQDTVTKQ